MLFNCDDMIGGQIALRNEKDEAMKVQGPQIVRILTVILLVLQTRKGA
jgi:hypothetical protein